MIKLTVEVNAAPVSFINLKKIKPPIAVLSIPNTIPKIILWLVGDALIGSSKIKTRGSNIIQAKYVEPVSIYNGLKLGIFLA